MCDPAASSRTLSVEHVPQLLEPGEQPRLDRPDRDVERGGDLLIRAVAGEAQDQDVAQLVPQHRECRLDLAPPLARQDDLLRLAALRRARRALERIDVPLPPGARSPRHPALVDDDLIEIGPEAILAAIAIDRAVDL